MKQIFGILLALLILPAVFAVNLDVEKISEKEVLIIDLDQPAQFLISVTNNGATDDLSFYTFFGEGLSPVEPISFLKGETKNVTLTVYPRENMNIRGPTNFNYFIQGKDRSEIEEKLNVNIIELKDAFEVGSSSIDPESSTLKIYIKNKVNFNFENVNVKFSSPFFNLGKEVSLKPYETEEYTVDINKEDFNKLMAGFYTLKAKVEVSDVNADIEGKIEFVEKDLLKTESKNYGLIISTKIIKKTNDGNTIQDSETTIKKNIISRLFTTFSPEPDSIDREGAKVYYTWTQKIAPGEYNEIVVKTNWLLPFLIILFLISSIYFARKYSEQKISLRKRVTFVKAKGGEFALKVTIIAEAREFVEKIKIVDRLPPLVQIYERFGGELPDRISKDKKRLEWDFDYLDKGERRVMSYVVYSKVGVLGRFALPGTTAYFEQEGKQKQATSNKAFFLAEQKSRSQLE
ncbi:hypothetical protein GW932_00645 [archaeon]|nr:hypothetical protein [archaeon]